MMGYKEFQDDVTFFFKEVIARFGFKVTEGSQSKVVLSSSKCRIKVCFTDWFECNTFIEDPQTSHAYNIGNIVRILGRQDIRLPDVTEEECNLNYSGVLDRRFFQQKMKIDASVLIYRLNDVLNGNFSWVKLYKERAKKEYDETSPLYKKLWSLEPTHPAYLKFRKGDETWKDDIRELIRSEFN